MPTRGRLHLSPVEDAAVERLVTGARELLGESLKQVRLFGSRARMQGTADSDVDIAFIVEPGTRARRYEVYDLAYDIGLETGVLLAPLVIEEDRLAHLRARERRIALDIEREGVPL